jgi:addiction module RelB/DinJ family antitoxin
MATKTITVRVDEDIKHKAEMILDDIGINITSLFNACLKALVREERIPFDLVSNDYLTKKIIREKLEESIAAAADPNEKRYTHEEIFETQL